ncbi:c-type cytochrome [Massilia sp. CCM 9210]|uniref:c-type cytochrome n=1 Tax=Massilia scottii TaxID=3057166 RepID=UPI0027964953|nr:c-type cytochrome [Massilia sp. CCM 9210]MDQ1812683.1 c-type cytochrome [Massilia sp. CCM 9210]
MPSDRVRLILKTAAATLACAALAAAAGTALVLKSGWYNVASTDQHFQFVHTLLEQGMRDSVRFHARGVAVPKLDAGARIARGALLYRDHCVQCHGAPGVAQQDFGKSMQPVPGPLVDAARRWQAAELYWITKNGIKMSGMPAWEFHLADDDIWSVVAFMVKLPELAPPAYAAMTASSAPAPAASPAPARWPGNPARGRIALTQYACNACHVVPGVTGPETYVGRPLGGLGKRRFIAGHLPNTQENLVRWIRDPHAIDPLTAMPVQDVSEADAVDISAYLLTLR